jgi:hypothetical protein
MYTVFLLFDYALCICACIQFMFWVKSELDVHHNLQNLHLDAIDTHVLVVYYNFWIRTRVAFCIPAKFKHISKRSKKKKLNVWVMANEIMCVHQLKCRVCSACCLICLMHSCRMLLLMVLEKSFVVGEILMLNDNSVTYNARNLCRELWYEFTMEDCTSNLKQNNVLKPIVNKYCEGNMKSILERHIIWLEIIELQAKLIIYYF